MQTCRQRTHSGRIATGIQCIAHNNFIDLRRINATLRQTGVDNRGRQLMKTQCRQYPASWRNGGATGRNDNAVHWPSTID